MRIGAVSYLNTKPLVHRLGEFAPSASIVYDLPSRLADRLAAGELDVALIPSIEYFAGDDYRIVSDACIACRGPVLSVKLFSRRPASEIRSVALDAGSRTSAALVRILLRRRFGLEPELRALPIEQGLEDADADAVLLIGDRAIHSPLGEFVEVWDLGDQWVRTTGLPFVFAMWTGRAGEDLDEVAVALAAARDAGVADVEAIAAREAPRKGLSVPECLNYLRDNLYFYLGPREQRGLEQYWRWASEQDLAPKGLSVDRFRNCTAIG